MARQVRDANLETRNARRRLKVQGKPYWKAIDQGLHIGYRKHSSGGTWIARRLNEQNCYREKKLSNADDIQDANSITVLNFTQAQEAARIWFQEEVRKVHGDYIGGDDYTLADAMRDYLNHYSIEGKGLITTRSIINSHILPSLLGSLPLNRLTSKKITEWHHNLAKAPALLRTAKAVEKRNTRPINNDPDITRARRATANRVLTVLKASLNYAWKEGKIANDTAWRKVKPFKSVEAPVIRYLNTSDCSRLVNACPADFRLLVKAALFTGCRYSELTMLKITDFNPDAGTIAIRTSKSGKPRYVVLTDEANDFFKSSIAGKLNNNFIFTHAEGTVWGKSHQSRPLAAACKAANIAPSISFHILRHTHGSLLAMQGVPMPVIAKQLGHSDTRMTEKHYAHLSPSYVADTIRQHFPLMGFRSENESVVQLRK